MNKCELYYKPLKCIIMGRCSFCRVSTAKNQERKNKSAYLLPAKNSAYVLIIFRNTKSQWQQKIIY